MQHTTKYTLLGGAAHGAEACMLLCAPLFPVQMPKIPGVSVLLVFFIITSSFEEKMNAFPSSFPPLPFSFPHQLKAAVFVVKLHSIEMH